MSDSRLINSLTGAARIEIASKPQPDPWRSAGVIASALISAATVKAAGLRAGGEVGAAVARIAQDDVDGICPPPRKFPWPGPRPYQLASAILVEVAANVHDKSLQTEIMSAARRAYATGSPVIG